MSRLRFDEFMELALYDDERGFFATTGAAGRRGDFITSPEVGPLFGAVIARALDAWWDELGRPAPFVVVEAGAGVGTLARSVAAASPRCGDALDHVLVERSAALRAKHPQGLRSRAELPAEPFRGVIIANELLDNLPFRIVERTIDGWAEVMVDERDGELAEVLAPADPELGTDLPDLPVGARVPLQEAAMAWLRTALDLVTEGRVVVIDYAGTTTELAERGTGWLRTFRSHDRGRAPLEDVGAQDITTDVAIDQLSVVRRPDTIDSQADFLRRHGIEQLVEEGRQLWHERAHIGDLEAIRGRSRVGEAEALLDPSGLGAFTVLEWRQP